MTKKLSLVYSVQKNIYYGSPSVRGRAVRRAHTARSARTTPRDGKGPGEGRQRAIEQQECQDGYGLGRRPGAGGRPAADDEKQTRGAKVRLDYGRIEHLDGLTSKDPSHVLPCYLFLHRLLLPCPQVLKDPCLDQALILFYIWYAQATPVSPDFLLLLATGLPVCL